MKHAILPLALALVVFAFGATAEEEGDKPAPAPAAKRPVALMKTSMGDVKLELFADETPRTVASFLELAEGKREWTDPASDEKQKRPYFDGLVFHRVIKGFMIQGGCPLGNGSGGPGYQFENEINGKALGLDKLKVVDGGRPHPWLLVRSQQDFQRAILGPLYGKMGIKSQEDWEARKDEINERIQAMTLLEAYMNQGFKFDDSRPSHKPVRGVLAMANAGPGTNGSQFFINLADTPHLTGKHTVFGKVVGGMEVIDKIALVEVHPGSNKPVQDVKIVSVRRVD